jgi:Domain of unknown function (DUF3846)
VTRVILCRVGERPRVTWLARDRDGGHAAVLCELLGAPVALVPLYDGVHLCCDRDGLLLGLTLARRALARSVPWRSEIIDRSVSPISGDFLLARINALGELVDLTELDVRFYLFWLGLEHVLHR